MKTFFSTFTVKLKNLKTRAKKEKTYERNNGDGLNLYLRPYQEIIGILKSIDSDESLIKIKFTIDIELDIPKNACPKDHLKKFIGKRIGIFNKDGKYLIRELD